MKTSINLTTAVIIMLFTAISSSWAGTTYSYDAQKHFMHNTGFPAWEGSGGSIKCWEVQPGRDKMGHMMWGKYLYLSPNKLYTASLNLRTDSSTAPNKTSPQLAFEVYDVTAKAFLVRKEYKKFDLLPYGSCTLQFKVPQGHLTEFRVYWYGAIWVRALNLQLR